MKKRNGANALVCEMLIVSLLFALSATVVLRVFSASYQESERAGAAERALCHSSPEMLARRIFAKSSASVATCGTPCVTPIHFIESSVL